MVSFQMHPHKLLSLTLCFWLKSLLKPGSSHGGHGMSSVNLILISFDGFRWDYLNIVKEKGLSTPCFDEFVKMGSSSGNGGIKNAFITKTFPNHYSLATGFYEESHGIVANSFFDPLFNETFDMNNSTSKDQRWWDGKSGKSVEPIWVTNEKCNCVRKSGVIFWPGADVENQRPSHLLPFNESISFETRVDVLVDWFAHHEPINLGMLYFEEPDRTGHTHGPESKELVDKVVELDRVLGFLITKLKEEELFDKMNIVITSDHGMVVQKGVIYLDDYVSPQHFKIYGTTPVFNVQPTSGHEEEVYNTLKNIPNLIVYKKENIPGDYHYQHNRRIMPLVVTAEEGYTICVGKSACKTQIGDHGYNNSLMSMHPVFISAGPAFRKSYTVEQPFETVDVYPLLCHILGIEPHENEGDLSRISQVLLRNVKNLREDLMFLGVTLVVIAVALTFCICVCHNHLEFFFKSRTVGQEEGREGQKRLLASEEDDELV